MPSAHRALITLANKLGYTEDEGGLCHGMTLRCLEAYLLDEQDAFITRINTINNTDNLDGLICGVQEKVKRHEILTDDEPELLDIPAFYDSLFLYQKPRQYQKLFNQSLFQFHIDEISHLAGSKRIQENGGLSTRYSAPNCFTHQELKNYLGDIQAIFTNEALNTLQANIGILISSHNHKMGLFYQAKNDTWTFMDINQWPPFDIPILNNTNSIKKVAQRTAAPG